MKHQEFQNWFEVFFKICVDLNITIQNATYLINDSITEDERKIIRHGFFVHHLYQLKFISTVQICKILIDNHNQKFNIHKVKRRLDREQIDKEFEETLKKNDMNCNNLKELFNQLNEKIEAHSYEIKKLKLTRDKVYAHRDREIDHIRLSWDIIRVLTFLLNEIYNSINGTVYDRHMDFSMRDWNVADIVKGYSRLKKLKIKST